MGRGGCCWRWPTIRLLPRWVLIGGLLVELHAHEHSVTPPRLTDDADVLVDVRTNPDGLPVLARWLIDHGLQLNAPGPDGVALTSPPIPRGHRRRTGGPRGGLVRAHQLRELAQRRPEFAQALSAAL
jgi:hypothetical protein